MQTVQGISSVGKCPEKKLLSAKTVKMQKMIERIGIRLLNFINVPFYSAVESLVSAIKRALKDK
jgi:hypothetical protein